MKVWVNLLMIKWFKACAMFSYYTIYASWYITISHNFNIYKLKLKNQCLPIPSFYQDTLTCKHKGFQFLYQENSAKSTNMTTIIKMMAFMLCFGAVFSQYKSSRISLSAPSPTRSNRRSSPSRTNRVGAYSSPSRNPKSFGLGSDPHVIVNLHPIDLQRETAVSIIELCWSENCGWSSLHHNVLSNHVRALSCVWQACR